MFSRALEVERLVLLGEPLAKLLSNLLSVIVNHFPACGLTLIRRRIAVPFLDKLFDNLDNLIPFWVADVVFVSAFVMPNVISDGHED